MSSHLMRNAADMLLELPYRWHLYSVRIHLRVSGLNHTSHVEREH